MLLLHSGLFMIWLTQQSWKMRCEKWMNVEYWLLFSERCCGPFGRSVGIPIQVYCETFNMIVIVPLPTQWWILFSSWYTAVCFLSVQHLLRFLRAISEHRKGRLGKPAVLPGWVPLSGPLFWEPCCHRITYFLFRDQVDILLSGELGTQLAGW